MGRVSRFSIQMSLALNRASALFGLAVLLLNVTPLSADVSLIRSLIRSGRFAEAIAESDLEIRDAPRSFALYTMKGLALHGSGNVAGALAAFRQALALNPTYTPALQAAAQMEFENRDPHAMGTLESILRTDPSSETAHAMLASILFDRQSCDAAIPHFERAAKAAQAPSMRWRYGVCLMNAQRWSDAALQFESLLRLREHGPTRYNLALAHWNARNYAAVVSSLAPAGGPGAGPDAMRLLASAHEMLGDTSSAFSVLQRALRYHPQNEPLLVDLAILCMDHRALELGLEVVRAGIQAIPASARLQTLLGVLLVRGGDTVQAQEAFQHAQELSPQSGLGSVGLASTLMQMGLADDAAKLLREQLAVSGPEPKAELTLARALLLNESTPAAKKEAVTLLQRLLKQEPGNAAGHALLGKAYAQLRANGEAITELKAALRLDPADRSSAYQLMIVYRQSGNSQEAAKLAEVIRSLLEKEKMDENASGRFNVVRDEAASTVP